MFRKLISSSKLSVAIIYLMATTATAQWERTGGPEGIAISSLATIDGIIYAGTEVNGVYISNDDGTSWIARNTGIETLEVTSIVSKPGYIFAGTFGGGVYRSTDGGQTWIAPSNGQDLAVTSLVIDDTYIFAGTISDGVQRSSDNGATWEDKLSGFLGFGAICKSGDKVMASASNYTFGTTDHGETWFNIDPLEGAAVFSYYCEGNMVFAGGRNKIYRSTDSGNSFTTINVNFPFSIVNIYSINAIGSTLFAATGYDGVYKSTNSGTSWTAANVGMGPKDVRAITATSSSTLIAGTHYVGVYRSTDMGTLWSKTVSGFPAGSNILSFLVGNTSVYAGTRDGVYRTDDNGDNWAKLTGANDTINYCHVWAMCQLEDVIYASMQLYFDAAIYKSTDKGDNWSRCPGVGLPPDLSFIKALVTSGDNIVAGTNEGIYFSTDGGAIWQQTNVINQNIPSLAASENYVYAAAPSGFGVLRSTDYGVSWTVALQSTVDYVEVAAIDNYAFAGSFFGGARYSSNNGSSWFASGGFPTDASVFVLGTVNDGLIIAGTDLAPSWIYASTNYGVSFSPYSEGLAERASVEAIAVNDMYMFTGTDDHGVWRRLVPGVVGVKTQQTLPMEYYLAQNYPNPFNPTTTIRFEIPLLGGDERVGLVTLKIYDILGNEVATLVNEQKTAGSYEVNFSAEGLPSGVYFYKLQAGSPSTGSEHSFVETRKMILMK